MTLALITRLDFDTKDEVVDTEVNREARPTEPTDAGTDWLADALLAIRRDDFEGAYRMWTREKNTAWQDERTLEDEATTLAVAFLARAVELEHEAPGKAVDAARYGRDPEAYASVLAPRATKRAEELALISEQLSRLTTIGNGLLADYTLAMRSIVEASCSCDDLAGLTGDTCEQPPVFAADVHACMGKLLRDHDVEVRARLGCVLPSLRDHRACLDARPTCDAGAGQACAEATRAALRACPPLSEPLRTVFLACID